MNGNASSTKYTSKLNLKMELRKHTREKQEVLCNVFRTKEFLSLAVRDQLTIIQQIPDNGRCCGHDQENIFVRQQIKKIGAQIFKNDQELQKKKASYENDRNEIVKFQKAHGNSLDTAAKRHTFEKYMNAWKGFAANYKKEINNFENIALKLHEDKKMFATILDAIQMKKIHTLVCETTDQQFHVGSFHHEREHEQTVPVDPRMNRQPDVNIHPRTNIHPQVNIPPRSNQPIIHPQQNIHPRQNIPPHQHIQSIHPQLNQPRCKSPPEVKRNLQFVSQPIKTQHSNGLPNKVEDGYDSGSYQKIPVIVPAKSSCSSRENQLSYDYEDELDVPMETDHHRRSRSSSVSSQQQPPPLGGAHQVRRTTPVDGETGFVCNQTLLNQVTQIVESQLNHKLKDRFGENPQNREEDYRKLEMELAEKNRQLALLQLRKSPVFPKSERGNTRSESRTNSECSGNFISSECSTMDLIAQRIQIKKEKTGNTEPTSTLTSEQTRLMAEIKELETEQKTSGRDKEKFIQELERINVNLLKIEHMTQDEFARAPYLC